MIEKVMVQFLYEGDTRSWEKIKPFVLREQEFDISRNNSISDELAGYMKVYNAVNSVKIEETRWQWGNIGQGHYIPIWSL
jgi:hypothetical protein